MCLYPNKHANNVNCYICTFIEISRICPEQIPVNVIECVLIWPALHHSPPWSFLFESLFIYLDEENIEVHFTQRCKLTGQIKWTTYNNQKLQVMLGEAWQCENVPGVTLFVADQETILASSGFAGICFSVHPQNGKVTRRRYSWVWYQGIQPCFGQGIL